MYSIFPTAWSAKLAAEAARLNLSLKVFALHVLAGSVLSTPAQRPRNGRELVAYWEQAGVIGSRPEIDDAPNHAREVRYAAERVRRDGQ